MGSTIPDPRYAWVPGLYIVLEELYLKTVLPCDLPDQKCIFCGQIDVSVENSCAHFFFKKRNQRYNPVVGKPNVASRTFIKTTLFKLEQSPKRAPSCARVPMVCAHPRRRPFPSRSRHQGSTMAVFGDLFARVSKKNKKLLDPLAPRVFSLGQLY